MDVPLWDMSFPSVIYMYVSECFFLSFPPPSLRCEQTLEEYMRLGRISDHFARLIVNQLAHSIKALHDKGFVHCDIKPSNIMCRMKSHEWLLIDFDSSCRVGEKIMNATPHYSSPEILQAEALGHRKEIIANGAIDVWAFAYKQSFGIAD